MFVVGEYGIPRIGYGHKVFVHALVRHVARDDDRIHILAPEPFERVLECQVVASARHLLVRTDAQNVDVGEDAKLETRLAARLETRRREDEAVAAKRPQRRERRAADEKLSS